MTSDQPGDRFSDDDEAFFQAGLAPGQDLPSERPVTLDSDDPVTDAPARIRVLETRRARFVRPVASTFAVLSLLALVGVVGHSRNSDSGALEQTAVSPARAATPGEVPPSSELELGQARVDDVTVDDTAAEELTGERTADSDDAELSSMCTTPSEPEPLASLPEYPEAEMSGAIMGPPSIAVPASIPNVAKPAKLKPVTHPPARRAAPPASPRRRSVPVGKAALLNAIRKS